MIIRDTFDPNNPPKVLDWPDLDDASLRAWAGMEVPQAIAELVRRQTAGRDGGGAGGLRPE